MFAVTNGVKGFSHDDDSFPRNRVTPAVPVVGIILVFITLDTLPEFAAALFDASLATARAVLEAR